jgi:peptidoglycan/LPS O-acetylase OafA/YrhL
MSQNHVPEPMPTSVFRAVQLMYASAGLTVLIAIIAIVSAPQVGVVHFGSTSVVESHTRQVVTAIFGAVVDGSIWLWMASKNKQGRAWARVTSTVLFAVFTVATVVDHTRSHPWFLALGVVTWLVALGATILLWLPGSGPFYRGRQELVTVR